MSDPIVTMKEVRELKLCARGAKQWFNGVDLDFRHFLTHGYPVSRLYETGDALAKRVADHAMKKQKATQ